MAGDSKQGTNAADMEKARAEIHKRTKLLLRLSALEERNHQLRARVTQTHNDFERRIEEFNQKADERVRREAAEREAKEKAEAEAKAKAEAEAKAKAEAEAEALAQNGDQPDESAANEANESSMSEAERKIKAHLARKAQEKAKKLADEAALEETVEQKEQKQRARLQQIKNTLDACSFLCSSNANMRAAVASLMLQQERVVGYLSGLTEKDKDTIQKRVTERYQQAEEEEIIQEEFLGVKVEPAPLDVPLDLCPVDSSRLATEWQKFLDVSRLTQPQTPIMESKSLSRRQPERGTISSRNSSLTPSNPATDFIVQSLSSNRELYVDAISKNNTSGAIDPDTELNYGFSLNQAPGYEYEFDEEDSELNIVTTGGTSIDDMPQIKCATLNKLIERMSMEGKQDLNVRYTFLLTYRSFTTAKEFLDKLAVRYFVPLPPNMTPDEIQYFKKHKLAPIQIKVFGVLKNWVEEHYHDDFEEDDELRSQLEALVQDTLERSYGAWSDSSAKSLAKLLDKKKAGDERNLVKSTDYPPVKLSHSVIARLTLDNFNLLDIHPLEIARQLTLQDFAIFKQIKAREFLNKSWTKSHKNESAPHIVAMIQRFNQVCGWVQLTVLGHADIETRSALLVKFLKVAKHCKNLNNFHSLYAIYSALNANPIHRLRKTWEVVPQKQLTRFENFKKLFDGSRNYKNFRTTLLRAVCPAIPHIGLFLADLIFIEDGNPDNLRGMINFQKRRMLAERIQWIKSYQQVAYQLQDVPVLQQYFTKRLAVVDEEHMWQLSLAVEPRDTD